MIPDDSMVLLIELFYRHDFLFKLAADVFVEKPPRKVLRKKLLLPLLWHRCKYLTAALAHNKPSDEHSLDATDPLGGD